MTSAFNSSAFFSSRVKSCYILVRMHGSYDIQVKIEQGHLMDALGACTDEAPFALDVIRLNEELDLKIAFKMYAKALEVRRTSIHRYPCLWHATRMEVPGTLGYSYWWPNDPISSPRFQKINNYSQ